MKSCMESQVFEKLAKIAGGIINPEIEDWKKQGGKVMGYFCPVVPEELIIAAGVLPFRMRATGSTSTSRADVYFTDFNCDFPRHCFNQALLGNYDFLDGIIIPTCCDTIRRLFENWLHAGIKPSFIYQLDHVHASREVMVGRERDQLLKFKKSIEQHFKVEISDQSLQQAISLCNESRRLQQQLYELRKMDSPPITGSETVAVMVASSSMPREQYNKDLRALLDELGVIKSDTKYKARLMIVGSGHDDVFLSDIIEEMGAALVTDNTCYGPRLFVQTVEEGGTDPLLALAKYQVMDTPYCPKMMGAHEKRLQLVLDLARDYRVDGIIGETFLGCDPWGGEVFMLRSELKDAGIPFISYEREFVPSLEGQIKTRVEAFLEMMGKGM